MRCGCEQAVALGVVLWHVRIVSCPIFPVIFELMRNVLPRVVKLVWEEMASSFPAKQIEKEKLV